MKVHRFKYFKNGKLISSIHSALGSLYIYGESLAYLIESRKLLEKKCCSLFVAHLTILYAGSYMRKLFSL